MMMMAVLVWRVAAVSGLAETVSNASQPSPLATMHSGALR